MKADLDWGELYPAFFATFEDEGPNWFQNVSPVELPDDLVARYRAAREGLNATIEAIREHCERTGQPFPRQPA